MLLGFGEEGTLCHNQTCKHMKITGLDPPAEVACPFLEQVAVVAHNHNSNPRNDKSHHNMGHCSRLDNPHNRNSRNRNL